MNACRRLPTFHFELLLFQYLFLLLRVRLMALTDGLAACISESWVFTIYPVCTRLLICVDGVGIVC